MDKRKLIPICIAVVLLILAIILFVKNRANSGSYTKLIVEYQSQKKEYTNLSEVQTFTVGEHEIIISGVMEQLVILTTNEKTTLNGKEIEAYKELEIKGGKSNKICFESKECFNVEFSR